MKPYIIFLCGILLGVLLTFVIIFNCGTFEIGQEYHFQTLNKEFEFSTMPSKGRDVAMMERQFQVFKNENSNLSKLQLFRQHRKNYLRICQWANYKVKAEWQYPYIKK